MMFEQYRWYYNCVLGIVNGIEKREPDLFKSLFVGRKMNFSKVRDHFSHYKYEEHVQEESLFIVLEHTPDVKNVPRPSWWSEVHNRIHRGAIKSLVQNYNSALANYKAGNITHFHLKPKTKKTLSEEVLFEDKKFPAWLKSIKSQYYKGHQKINTKILLQNHNKGLILFHDRVKDTYHLQLPVPAVPLEIPSENQAIISLDTGVRTFQTGYSPDGHILEIGKSDNLTLEKLLRKTDKLQEKYKETNNKKYQKQRLTVFRRIKNLVKDLHWKTIKYLTSNYGTILVPDFRISGMVKQKKLPRMTKRMLYMYSYHAFKQRLLWKAGLAGVKVLVVDESYTTKTCGRCGWQHETLGGLKTYTCNACGLVSDRDHNAARNILLKHL